jgi:CBS domain-containing protein
MNRNVAGLGHDPKTEPVEAHIQKNSAYCLEDQTISEAERIMLKAKVGEVPGSRNNRRKIAGRSNKY